MRQLFRKEYAKEIEDTQLALDAEPGFAPPLHKQPTAQYDAISTETNNPHIEVVADATPSVVPPPDGKQRGFWGSLFKRKK